MIEQTCPKKGRSDFDERNYLVRILEELRLLVYTLGKKAGSFQSLYLHAFSARFCFCRSAEYKICLLRCFYFGITVAFC